MKGEDSNMADPKTTTLLISQETYEAVKGVMERVRSGQLSAAEPIWCLYSAIVSSMG